MHDKPTFGEQYGRAAQSSNLRQRERGIGDTDRLAAMAWADPELATHLYRARVTNDATAARQLRERWSEYCVKDAARRRWTLRAPVVIECIRIDADVVVPPFLVRRIATTALDHWLVDNCKECSGRKFKLKSEVMKGTATDGRDVLSDVICPNCHGTGLEPLRTSKELRMLVERCIKMLQDLYADAATKATQKLGA